MSSLHSSVTGPFLGAATNRRPQVPHRNVGVPAAFRPFRAAPAAPHRGHRGTEDIVGMGSVIRTWIAKSRT